MKSIQDVLRRRNRRHACHTPGCRHHGGGELPQDQWTRRCHQCGDQAVVTNVHGHSLCIGGLQTIRRDLTRDERFVSSAQRVECQVLR